MTTDEKDGSTTWLTKRELSNYLAVKIRTVDYLVKRGKLPTPYAFSKRMKRWDLKEIEKHIRDAQLKELPKEQPKE